MRIAPFARQYVAAASICSMESVSPAEDVYGGEGAPLAEVTRLATVGGISYNPLLREALGLASALRIVPDLSSVMCLAPW